MADPDSSPNSDDLPETQPMAPTPADPNATEPVWPPSPSPAPGPSRPSDSHYVAELPLPEQLQAMLGSAYVVESFLGQGGMGAVYRGLQMPLRRPVAIKILARRQPGEEDDFAYEERSVGAGTYNQGAAAMQSLEYLDLDAPAAAPSALASGPVIVATKDAPAASAVEGWEDFLAPLTPELVAQTGHGWRMDNGVLSSPSKSWATLPLPGNLSGTSYQVRVKLRQLTLRDNFHVSLPVGDRMTGFDVDVFGGKYTGLQFVNRKRGQDIPGVVEGKQVKDFEQHDLQVTVQLDGANATVTATLDGHSLYEWAGLITALSMDEEWGPTEPGTLALGTLGTGWAVSEVKVKRLDK